MGILSRPIPSRTHGASPMKSFLKLITCMYGAITHLTNVEAAASEALLGGQYVPTTDVGFIEDLTILIEAITTEPSSTKGQQFYTKTTPDSSFSLESIAANSTSCILNSTTNPLYGIYLYGFYKSANGNGGTNSGGRTSMTFLDEPVDYYGHTIITDEFNKQSGYNSSLNAETIRVTNMWMATVQSLYDASALCHNGMEGVDSLAYVSPIDKAAAFYFGTHEDESSTDGGSLYAWAGRAREIFVNEAGFNVNDAMRDGLKVLQATLGDCLDKWEDEITDEQEYEMDKEIEKLTNRMTVPLVQNLIYYGNEVAKATVKDDNTVDFLILYALVTLPPIRVCDANAFDTLYKNFVTSAAMLDTTILASSLEILFNNFICLGVTCDQVGIPDDIIYPMAITLPDCFDPPMDIQVAGYAGTYERMLESAVVDLDILTIASLVEMEANGAAEYVYWWNNYGLALSQTMDDVSLSDMATAFNHEKNTVATLYDNEWDYELDDLIMSVIHKTDAFSSASSSERRVVVEKLLATIVVPIYALDSMYRAIDNCNSGLQDTSEWDKAVASLVGFLEGRDGGGTDGGILFYDIAQFLCNTAGCSEDTYARVNVWLMGAFDDNRDRLLALDCTAAEEQIYEIELHLQMILIDAVAYYTNEIFVNPTDKLLQANGYAFATALYPTVQRDESGVDNILMENLGVFGQVGDVDLVMTGLKAYVDSHNNMDCRLFYHLECDVVSTTSSTVMDSFGIVATEPPADGAVISSLPPDGSGYLYAPTSLPTLYLNPTETSGLDSASSPMPSSSTYYPTYVPSVTGRPTSSSVLDGGVLAINDGTVSSPLYSGAYTPTSNVDHILKLMEFLDEIEKPGTTKDAALAFYTLEVEVGLSLQTLSTSSDWNYVTNINPLQIIYMYGLWISGDGDNDSNGYSNKKFDDGNIEQYGNSIIMDGFNKNSGFDQELTAETIRVTNVWMTMVTELYKAVESCGDGSASGTEPGFNPIDHAAAFWFGSTESSDEYDGSSLHAWTARAGKNFINQSAGVNDEMITSLNDLQARFADCKQSLPLEVDELSNNMRKTVLYMTRLMTVPLVQNFITDLASKVGKSPSERDYLILYSLVLLPQLSVCDEDMLDTLFNDLVLENAKFDSSKFGPTLQSVQDSYDCLGIHCSLVGTSESSDPSWPVCVDRSDPNFIPSMAGYAPFSKASTQLSKIDLDVSTILSFIMMEANGAAWDIYTNGRNVVGDEGSYLSLSDLKIPKQPPALEIYNKFHSDFGFDYIGTTEMVIQGIGSFASTSPLQNSAAARLSMVSMDLHLAILDTMYEAVDSCRAGNDPLVARALIDRAVALTVGSTEGQTEFGSATNGLLFFQLAQEACENFNSCDEDGKSEINKKLVLSFSNADGIISLQDCDQLEEEVSIIETHLQTILIDNLAYHLASAETDERHYLMSHVLAFALLPFMKTVDRASADVVEQNLAPFPTNLKVPDGVAAVSSAIKSYVDTKGINCSLFGSSICEGITSSDADQDSVAVPNSSGYTLAKGEYTPFTDITQLAGLSTVMSTICASETAGVAKSTYNTDETAGLTLSSLSLTAKNVMADELLFNQYIYSFFDDVDKAEGTLLFDDSLAVEYSNTIISDAIDDNLELGCLAVKVLSMWMWVVHKLNDSIQECKNADATKYGSIDEAAAFWIGSVSEENNGGLLYELAEQLGENFSPKSEGMATLNREIISRLNLAQATYFVNNTRCKTDDKALTGLRKLVKEITSYMTAVLIQGLINSIFENRNAQEKQAFVELYFFAFMPHISRCGHDDLKNSLYQDLVVGNFDSALIPKLIEAIHDQLNCLGLTCKDIGRHALADESYPLCNDEFDMLGYTPHNATKTNMPARIDLDAVAIHQLMSLEKYSTAKEIYLQGLNYYDYDDEDKFGFVSLHSFTQSETIGDTEFYSYKLYSDYLSKNPGNFIDDFIISALDKTDKFDKATAKQRELAVSTSIKSFISYMSALEALNLASSSCGSNKERAQTAWDGGAALLIGSVEGKQGTATYVNRTSDGRMFFSISDELCDHFDTCTLDGSTVTVDLLALLTQGQGHIKDSACTDAADTLKSIVQLCSVSLIQNALYFSDESSDEDNIAAGYIASMAVLPLVNEINSEAAEVIKKDMRFRPSPATDGEASAVLDAFKAVLSDPSSDIPCEKISNTHQLCTTPEPPASINIDEPSIISNGLYTATNYVTDRSTISLDVRDIEEKIDQGHQMDAIELYKQGKNSPTYSAIGQLTGKRSISKFSTDSPDNMMNNPVYNRFLFGLSDINQEFLGRPVTTYADSIVLELLYSKDRQHQLAAPNAMVLMNIWMQVVHKMYSAHSACRLGEGDPSLFIDEAAAYWIGDSQDTGSSSQGHLLYALTEFVGHKFEVIPEDSQSIINTRIIDQFNQAKSHIALTKSCTTSPSSHLKLRSIIDDLVVLMAVPLLRGLFWYLSIRDAVKTKLYAVSILPLFSTCSKSAFTELKGDLIDNDPADVDKDLVFSKILSMYDCLGLSCDLVGFMPLNNFTHCQESTTHDELVGFSYEGDHDTVIEHSKIDVDIRTIESFITNGLDIFPTNVEDLFNLGYEFYQFEQYSSSDYSIKSLATSDGRELVPSYASFLRYFSDDRNYADSIISSAFSKGGIFTSATTQDRRKVISFSMRYMVTYMAILEKLYTSLDLCRDSQQSDAHNALDAAAAYFVGSSEGEEDGGTYDGVLLYMLANRMCIHFRTCGQSNNAEANEKILSLFYAAQGEVDVKACDALAKTIKGIENALTVPLIQGTLYTALENDLFLSKVVSAEDLLPEGYVLAQSVLPLIHDIDPTSATEIADVMVKGFPRNKNLNKSANHAKVFRAMQTALPKMKGIDCAMVGTIAGVSFCPGAETANNSCNLLISKFIFVSTSLMLFLLL